MTGVIRWGDRASTLYHPWAWPFEERRRFRSPMPAHPRLAFHCGRQRRGWPGTKPGHDERRLWIASKNRLWWL